MLQVGLVRRAHGLAGEVRVEPLGIDAETLSAVDAVTVRRHGRGEQRLEVEGVRPGPRGALLVRLAGVADRTAAEGLAGAELFVDEGSLPPLDEDEYYYFELVGAAVEDAEGRPLGRVTGVFCAGASDVAVVERPEGEWMFPVVDSIVRELDVEGGRVVVDLLDGLLEGGE